MKKSPQQKKQEHLLNAKIFQALGFQKSCVNEFQKAAEIHLKISEKKVKQ